MQSPVAVILPHPCAGYDGTKLSGKAREHVMAASMAITYFFNQHAGPYLWYSPRRQVQVEIIANRIRDVGGMVLLHIMVVIRLLSSDTRGW